MNGKSPAKYKKPARKCAYCGLESPIIWVHGHGQCANCGINVEECCQGAQCEIAGRKNSQKL